MRNLDRGACPDAAPPGFDGLLAGAWKIVDRFESADQRYVVAEADSASRPLCPLAVRALSLAMLGHANKVIAIELGASQPTVTRLLSRALRCLRVSGMREAIALAHTQPVWLFDGNREVFSWRLRRSSWCDDAALSAAERDVVQRIADGASRADIARARGTSLHTVHSQIASAFTKLGVGSKRELMQRASWISVADAAPEGAREGDAAHGVAVGTGGRDESSDDGVRPVLRVSAHGRMNAP